MDYLWAMFRSAVGSKWSQVKDAPPDERRLVMSRTHRGSVEFACRKTLQDKGLSPEPETLERDYWTIVCQWYDLGDPRSEPNPFHRPASPDRPVNPPTSTPAPAQPLPADAEQTFRREYQKAFTEGMEREAQRNPSSSLEDRFFGAALAARHGAAAVLTVSGVDISDDDVDRLSAEEEQVNRQRYQ